MNKLFLALVFAGASQGSFFTCVNGGHPFVAPVGELCASAPRDSTIPALTARDSFSANLVVPDGPESDYIVFRGNIIGNLEDSRFHSGGVADVTTLLGTNVSIPGLNFLPSPADPCCGSGMLETMSYLYTRGVPFPFSVELRVTSYYGGTANAEVSYDFHFEEPYGLARRPVYGMHVEVADDSPPVANPEPATFFTAGAMLGLIVTCTRPSRSKKDG